MTDFDDDIILKNSPLDQYLSQLNLSYEKSGEIVDEKSKISKSTKPNGTNFIFSLITRIINGVFEQITRQKFRVIINRIVEADVFDDVDMEQIVCAFEVAMDNSRSHSVGWYIVLPLVVAVSAAVIGGGLSWWILVLVLIGCWPLLTLVYVAVVSLLVSDLLELTRRLSLASRLAILHLQQCSSLLRDQPHPLLDYSLHRLEHLITDWAAQSRSLTHQLSIHGPVTPELANHSAGVVSLAGLKEAHNDSHTAQLEVLRTVIESMTPASRGLRLNWLVVVGWNGLVVGKRSAGWLEQLREREMPVMARARLTHNLNIAESGLSGCDWRLRLLALSELDPVSDGDRCRAHLAALRSLLAEWEYEAKRESSCDIGAGEAVDKDTVDICDAVDEDSRSDDDDERLDEVLEALQDDSTDGYEDGARQRIQDTFEEKTRCHADSLMRELAGVMEDRARSTQKREDAARARRMAAGKFVLTDEAKSSPVRSPIMEKAYSDCEQSQSEGEAIRGTIGGLGALIQAQQRAILGHQTEECFGD